PPDPLFLHQPANEVVIGLAVLNTIFPRGIGPLEVESNTIGLNSASREDLADDLGDAQSLKDTRAVSMREEPDARNQFGSIICLVDLWLSRVIARSAWPRLCQ